MNKHVLLCPPDYYDVAYEINAWMHADQPVDHAQAAQEWQKLADIYAQLGWNVEYTTAAASLPDMVFATDTCLIIGGKVLLSRFRYAERQPEVAHCQRWLRAHGYGAIHQAKNYCEGGGDNLVCGNRILAGHGFRSSPQVAAELRAYFDCEVIPLTLVNPLFYHLDTAVAVLDADTVAYYPAALDEPSRQRLTQAIPRCIEATLEEAGGFGLNVVSDGHTVITSDASPSLLQKYADAGLMVIGTPIDEFRKAGGGAKCMTLDLRD